jgi:hypothetical protein
MPAAIWKFKDLGIGFMNLFFITVLFPLVGLDIFLIFSLLFP